MGLLLLLVAAAIGGYCTLLYRRWRRDAGSKAAATAPKKFCIAVLLLVAAAIAGYCMLVYSLRSGDPGLKVGATAPTVEGAGWLNGGPPQPESLKGRVIVVFAWTSSGYRTGPCTAELKHLRQADREFKFASRDVVFLGMTPEGEDELSHIKNVLGSYGKLWPNAWGAEKSLAAYKVEVKDLPGVWVIGKDGKVVWNRRSIAIESMEHAIENALAAPDPPVGKSR